MVLQKSQFLSPNGNVHRDQGKYFGVPKKGQSNWKATLEEGQNHYRTWTKQYSCPYRSGDSPFHVCNLLCQVFQNVLDLCKITKGKRHLLYSTGWFKLWEELAFSRLNRPGSGHFSFMLGSAQGLNSHEARNGKRVMKINHVIWLYHFLGSFCMVSTFKEKYFLLEKKL